MKYTAHIDRLMTFVQHGQPKDYGGSHMMCSDVALLLNQVSTARGCNPEEDGAPGDGTGPAAGTHLTTAQQYWLDRRAQIIEALAAYGLQIVSTEDRVWIAPY